MTQVRLKRRCIDGVLLFDKPIGWSSNDAVQRVRRLFNAEKTGHTGTLDPLATGLLPLLMGEATKFSADLLDADKSYLARVRLGAVTATGDLEGDIVQQCEPDMLSRITLEQVRDVVATFAGPQQQVPPMYSALKRDGKALYEYARAGVQLDLEPRSINIAAIAVIGPLMHCQSDDGRAAIEFDLDVTCSKGTYIRVLAEDIGKQLGCGAHLSALRRTAVGELRLSDADVWTYDSLQDMAVAVNTDGAETTGSGRKVLGDDAIERCLSPVDSLLATLPAVHLEAEKARRYSQGQRLPLGPRTEQGRVRVYAADGQRFLGTGLMNNDGVGHSLLCPDRLIRVIREPQT